MLLLSGTPALSRPSELYTQLAAIDHRAFPNYHNYGLRYCEAKQVGGPYRVNMLNKGQQKHWTKIITQ